MTEIPPVPGASDAGDAGAVAEAMPPLLDVAVIRMLCGPSAGVMLLERLSTVFEEEVPQLFLDIQAGLEVGSPKRVQGAVHALGSLCAMVGAVRLGRLAEAYEHAAREEDLIDGDAGLLGLMEVYEETLAALEARLARRR